MARVVLTEKAIKALKPASVGKRLDYFDAVVPGLAVRVTDKRDGRGKAAHRTFTFTGRFPGSQHPTRRAIGRYGKVTLEDARKIARAWYELLAKGIDPRDQERREREEQDFARESTFGAVVEDYLARHVKAQRRAADVERVFNAELLPKWRKKPLAEISRRDVVKVVDSIADRRAPYQAHAVLGHVRTFFNWAINRGIYVIEASPCDRLKPTQLIGARQARQRVLTDEEIVALWRATERIGYPYGTMYRLLLLTGQRKSEVAGARWDEFNLTARLWTVPAERFKSAANHLVPLSEEALTLLGQIPEFEEGGFLFSASFGKRPVASFAKEKARLDRLMSAELGRPVEAFVVHDLRRTVRTRLSGLRTPEPVAEMVIGHARRGLARIYDQHKFLDEMREALDAWGAMLCDIVDPPSRPGLQADMMNELNSRDESNM